MAVSFSLTDEEQKCLGALAVGAIDDALAGRPLAAPRAETVPASMHRQLGCFVTLTIHGRLRGCIGLIQADTPLYDNVWRMALSAAFRDPRFRQLSAAEWPLTDVEINVLDSLSPCPNPDDIVIGRHGLVLRHRGRTGVFLPSVPVEQGWTLPQYLTHLCAKAGLPDGSWKEPGSQLLWYESFAFNVKRGQAD
ncbi:MAG: AmmeMemoRadiSam system protein A [Desulfovibrionaceae bacterium]|nr:AmmeMemoRadiSam system protein A [Desulfovibrionaceae bacterium]